LKTLIKDYVTRAGEKSLSSQIMKKSCWMALLTVLAFTAPAFAEKVTFGVKAGPSFNRMSGKYSYYSSLPEDYYTGWTIGGYARLPVRDFLSLHFELCYSRKGQTFSLMDMLYHTTGDYSIRIDYLELPILAYLELPEKHGLKPCFSFGPAFDIRVATGHGKTTPSASGYLEHPEYWVDKADLGLIFGPGVNFRGVLLELRYNYCFAGNRFEHTLKNRSLAFLAGYEF